MLLRWLVLFFFFCLVSSDFTIPTTELTGCSSHCTVAFDKNTECWDKTLAFFEGVIISTLRNVVATNVNIATTVRSQGGTPPSVEDIVADSKNAFNQAKIVTAQDENNLMTVGEAQEVMKVLANRVQEIAAQTKQIDVVCPNACEKSSSPWLPIFIASLALNAVLFMLAVGGMLLNLRRDERTAKRLYQDAVTLHPEPIKKED